MRISYLLNSTCLNRTNENSAIFTATDCRRVLFYTASSLTL